jgi:hypothetical protein
MSGSLKALFEEILEGLLIERLLMKRVMESE